MPLPETKQKQLNYLKQFQGTQLMYPFDMSYIHLALGNIEGSLGLFGTWL